MTHSVLTLDGHEYELNDDGRLHHIDDWSQQVADVIAQNEGITLTDEHWAIINLLRDFYQEYNHTPIMKLFLKEVSSKLGEDFASKEHLSRLFPQDVLGQSSKIAGLPSPHDETLSSQKARVVRTEAKPKASNQDSFDFEGKTYHLTKEGNLVENYAWDENMGKLLAQREGLELSEDHWLVINFMRSFYQEYLVVPMVKLLIKHMKESLSEDKCNKQYLYELFPGGPSKQGSRIAGLPFPAGCVD